MSGRVGGAGAVGGGAGDGVVVGVWEGGGVVDCGWRRLLAAEEGT